ncbi:MAG: class I SAM-dependent methyltransferase [Burkholderiaceae bacterium]|nr:class I SAM-dependent methyltransferase [Burkholderiaceae bacterium]
MPGRAPGAAARAIRPRAAQVCGVDFAPAYIDHARRSQPDPRIAFEVGDASALAYVDGEPRGPRSFAALAWAVKGIVPA